MTSYTKQVSPGLERLRSGLFQDGCEAIEAVGENDGREEEPVRLDGAVQVGVVLGPLDGLGRLEAALEGVRARGGVHLLGSSHADDTGWH